MTTATTRTWRTGDTVEITGNYTARCEGSAFTYPVSGLQRGETFPPCKDSAARAAAIFWLT